MIFFIRRGLIAAIAIVAVVSSVASTHAEIQQAQAIDTPISESWRVPFAGFLRTLGIKDPTSLLANTYVFDIGQRPGAIGLRVEDESTCHKDQCLTIIGRMNGKRFVVDAMFAAGKRYVRSEKPVPIFGSQTFPAWFVGEMLSVMALETERGWLIVPGLASQVPPSDSSDQ